MMDNGIWMGWEEITKKTKLRKKVIKKLAQRKDNPFPLAFIGGRYITTQEKFAEWVEVEIKNNKKY